jgi:hypothetical protein
MQDTATTELRRVFDASLGTFITLVIGKNNIDVWTDLRCAKFRAFVTETVTYAIADEARQIAKDPNFPSSPLDAKTMERAAVCVMQRQSIRDTCTYHLECFSKKLGIDVDRTKVCGPYFTDLPTPDC